MRKSIKNIIVCFLLLAGTSSFAQKDKVKFGDIKKEDFNTAIYSIDSNANAVVLFDIGSSEYEANSDGGIALIFKRHKRIRILNKSAFDLATIGIPLYTGSHEEERIDKLEACTYTLQNGKVQEYKLDRNAVYKDKLNKYVNISKFTLSNLKEGCIIEFMYTLYAPSDISIRSWHFQSSIPVLRSEYEVTIPSFFEFVVISNGYQTYSSDDVKDGNQTFYFSNVGRTATTFPANTIIHKWTMKNVPALKEEDFTTTMENHLSKISFQLSRINFPNVPSKEVMRNWVAVSKDMLKSETFGEALGRGNGWMADDLKNATAKATNDLEKAKQIYEYIRNNMSCTDYTATSLSNPLRKTYQNKNGNVADINLLLTAALVNQGISAKPMLLSTRNNGKVNESYPIMSQYNYVICQARVGGNTYFLDAAYSKLGFGKLNSQCYNGSARLIDEDIPAVINLSPDSVLENKMTNAFFINDDKEGFTGTVTTTMGQFESDNLREKLVKTGKEDFFKDVKKEYNADMTISDMELENLKEYDEPVVLKYNINIETKDDIIYLNPIFGEAYKENIFKSTTRRYPVEMAGAMNEVYILRMEIPKGYKVEEMPKSTRVKLNESEGLFEYLTSKDDNIIQLRSTVRINKATFLTEDYENLRNFFSFIVNKQSEQIVLKKIK